MSAEVSIEPPIPATSFRMPAQSNSVQLRRFPYPYRAMLAICSDLDETASAEVYRQQMRFLNTREKTSMGEGIGLEVGNSIYFDMPPNQFAYWNTDDAGREMVRALIRSGHIDCLHSFGDLATTRAHAERALKELDRHRLSLRIWIDHAIAPTNFGADIMEGHGDEVRHPAYHADLTLAHGISYVWRGRVTSIVGQDQPVRLADWKNNFVPDASLRTKSKEVAKQMLARLGHAKYRLHSGNRIAEPSTLRDGSSITEFLRCQPHPEGVDACDTGAGIAEVLTANFLDRLVERNGACILYTHLGKLAGHQHFDETAVRSFRLLSRYQHDGQILVTTTRRHLDYSCAHSRLQWTVSSEGTSTIIHLNGGIDATELQGLTFYADNPAAVQIRLDDITPLPCVVNPPDETRRASVSLPWSRLDFPQL
jgi:hypothetical protein